MGQRRYQFREQEVARDREKELHPIWRGVGCIMLILMAIGGYGFGGWFLQANAENSWIYLPPILFYPPGFPTWLPSGLVVRLAIGLLFVVIGYGMLSIFYAMFFPIQPGEFDAPPPKRRKRAGWRSRGR